MSTSVYQKAITILRQGGLIPFFVKGFSFISERLLLLATQRLNSLGISILNSYTVDKIFNKHINNPDGIKYFVKLFSTKESFTGIKYLVVPGYLVALNSRVASAIFPALHVASYLELDRVQPSEVLLVYEHGNQFYLFEYLKKNISEWRCIDKIGGRYFSLVQDKEIPAIDMHEISDDLKQIETIKQHSILNHPATGCTFHIRPLTVDAEIVDEVYCSYVAYLKGKRAKPKIAVDLGGHIGSFSVFLAKLFGTKVVCYEPNPQNFELIEKNIAANNIKSVTAFERAISDKSGMAILFESESTVSHRLHLPTSSGELRKFDVKVDTLKDIFRNFSPDEIVDVLKVDIEGSEYAALFPFGKLLSERVRCIVMEAEKSFAGSPLDMVAFLSKHGFKVVHSGTESVQIIYATNQNILE